MTHLTILAEERILKREGGTRDKIIINSTQKVSSRVLKSRNMMSVARTSFFMPFHTNGQWKLSMTVSDVSCLSRNSQWSDSISHWSDASSCCSDSEK